MKKQKEQELYRELSNTINNLSEELKQRKFFSYIPNKQEIRAVKKIIRKENRILFYLLCLICFPSIYGLILGLQEGEFVFTEHLFSISIIIIFTAIFLFRVVAIRVNNLNFATGKVIKQRSYSGKYCIDIQQADGSIYKNIQIWPKVYAENAQEVVIVYNHKNVITHVVSRKQY